MAAQTGRTVQKYTDFIIEDSGGTLRSIPVDSINGVGLDYEEVDLTAFQDAIRGVLTGHPDMTIDITGPFDTSAAVAAGTLSGSHTILSAIAGGSTPLAMDIQIGIRQAWEAGEPQFGISSDATNGVICTMYNVDPATGKYSARFRPIAGSAAPAWGTAAESVG
jgi:hypothetical protein